MTQRQVRIRHRRLNAAAAVADRARLCPGAFGPNDHRAALGQAGNGAAACANGHQVDHGKADRPAADAAIGGEAGFATVDEGNVRRGAADVDADEIGMSGAGADVGRAHCASGGARQRCLDGGAAHGARAGDAAARFHEQERRGDALIGHAPIELGHVGRHHRHDESIEDGGHAALVFAEGGQHLARQRNRRARKFRTQDLTNAAFVRRVGVTVQEHHGDGGDPALLQRARSGVHGGLVKRLELVAVGFQAAADLENQLRWHGTFRLHPGEQAGTAWYVLAPDLEHVLEARSRDQRGFGALALEDQVGRHRRAVQDAADVGGSKPRHLERLGNADAETARWVIGCGRGLGRPKASRRRDRAG